MKEDFFRKGMVIAIIVCFIGASVVPSISGLNKDVEITDCILNDNEKMNIKNDNNHNLMKQVIENSIVSNNVWLEQSKLLASDGAKEDWFGLSVSIDGDYALIGAYGDDDYGDYSGSAYVFKRDGTTWTQEAKLLASDGADGDYFGCSVSIDGDYALIGAYGDDDNGDYSGSAHVFKRDGTTWTQEAKLLASDGAYTDCFGCSVSIDGDYALIGAIGDDDNGASSGSAYVFKRTGTSWSEEAKLLPSDGAKEDWFGLSVSIDGDYALIGASTNWINAGTGSAYVFKRDGTTWTQEAKLLASDGADGDYFGKSVSIDGDYALIGAYGDDDNGADSGSAYVFKKSDIENEPPNKPSTSYSEDTDELIISATDPDDNQVRYGVSWENDNIVDYWTDFVDSGTELKVDCEGRKGTVGVIAMDEYGAISDWVSQKSKNKPYFNIPFLNFLQNFLENYPLIYQLLQRLLRL